MTVFPWLEGSPMTKQGKYLPKQGPELEEVGITSSELWWRAWTVGTQGSELHVF